MTRHLVIISVIRSHLTLCRFRYGILGWIHHVLFDHGIHDNLRTLCLFLRLALIFGLVGLAGLNVGDIFLRLLLRCRLRVNSRRGGRGLLPDISF